MLNYLCFTVLICFKNINLHQYAEYSVKETGNNQSNYLQLFKLKDK